MATRRTYNTFLIYPASIRGSTHAVESAHRTSRRGKLVLVDTHALQHRDEKVRERRIARGIEREVLAMTEASTHE